MKLIAICAPAKTTASVALNLAVWICHGQWLFYSLYLNTRSPVSAVVACLEHGATAVSATQKKSTEDDFITKRKRIPIQKVII